jgi:hypothetical protein
LDVLGHDNSGSTAILGCRLERRRPLVRSCATVAAAFVETIAVTLLKALILVLLIGVVVSLFSGLVFLFRDAERKESRRVLYALGVRIGLAVALLLAVLYGFHTGELRFGMSAPWHQTRHPAGEPAPVAPDAD